MTRHDPHRADLILAYIDAYRGQHGYAPSIQEITDAVGLASKAATQHHLMRMTRLGLLRRTPGVARSYQPTGDPDICPTCGAPR